MSNGEGFRDRMSEAPSPDLLDDDELRRDGVLRKIDSPASSSRYSSCGESEFNRFSSANSVMGTPSLCSSVGAFHECVDSDFGESLRSCGTLEGDFGLEGFNLDDRFGNVMSFSPGKAFNGAMDARGVSGSWYTPEQARFFDGSGDCLEEEIVRRGNELVLDIGCVEKFPQCSMEVEEREDDGYDDQEGTSSRFEHSEGEDSMFNSGSDGENRPNAHYMRQSHDDCELKSKGGNMIVMSSSIAFGSNDWDDFELERIENDSTSEMVNTSWQKAQSSGVEFNHAGPLGVAVGGFDGQERDGCTVDFHLASDEVHSAVKPAEPLYVSSVNPDDCFKSREKKIAETARDVFVSHNKSHSDDESIDYHKGCNVNNNFKLPNPLSGISMNGIVDKDNHLHVVEQISGHNENKVAKNRDRDQDQDRVCIQEEQLQFYPDMMVGQVSCSGEVRKDTFDDLTTNDALNDEKTEASDGNKLSSLPLGPEGNMGRIRNGFNHTEGKLPPNKGKTFQLNACYDEVVHDMEDVLLESVDSPVTRLKQRNLILHSDEHSPLRNDGSTTSTSSAVDRYPLTFQHSRIDGIEVAGAKQKKGDVSLSERLVGVKEHTVYLIRVWSGEDQWEVERRYRDFYTLYHRLKSLFADQGWILPSSWSAVEWESRNFFGNSSTDVVLERSALIQVCLNSVLQFNYPSGPPNALIWFLSPPKALSVSIQSNIPHYESTIDSHTENISIFGNTMSLIVDVPLHKSVKQTLEEQHYTCPGCHKHLDDGQTQFWEFFQTFGLGKPRLCEYTGRLFCASCHTYDRAVLPARVLHHWDFTEYPVSQLAKLFLDSIIDQPMLCVSAVNPFLLSKVKVLLHVVSLRRKVKVLLDYVHCPFHGTIYRKLGCRRYLVESTDFFSLANLIDLSRGAFAALPVILETISKKIEEHITVQCLVCCDIGAPCAARQTCDDISSLIFPFQDEDEVRRCQHCKLPFHKRCFAKLNECSCGADLKVDHTNRSVSKLSRVPSGCDGGGYGALPSLRMQSDLGLRSSPAFLSKLLSLGKKENSVVTRQEGHNFILMGSLPGNSF